MNENMNKVQLSEASLEELAKLQAIVDDVNEHKEKLVGYQSQLSVAQKELAEARELSDQGAIMRAVTTIQALEMMITDARTALAQRKAYYNDKKRGETINLVKGVRSAIEKNERHQLADKLERIKALEEEIEAIKNEAIATQAQVNSLVAPYYDRLERTLAKGTAFDSMISSSLNKVNLYNKL